ncbi:DUF1064 domain-containing protein [Methylobacter sp. Wu1]|uniref:DUF1064 domain-containing protein n=1 Tax=Methylobacter sp. Wu1 TaxID=3119359 RepID=UPI002F959FEC
MRATKYKNRKTLYDGIEFDSSKEASYYQTLKWREEAGEIDNLQTQVKYTLIPAQKRRSDAKTEKQCGYVADFVFHDIAQNKTIVVDVKSAMTRKLPAYIIKRKLMLMVHGIEIQEI